MTPPRVTLFPMRLLAGPAGSGKTAFVLERMREALRAGNHRVRLLVPTATMAQHLQNRLAREGFVFRCAQVETLSAFVAPLAGEMPQAPDVVLHLLVERAVRRVDRPEFASVAHMRGFCAALAGTIQEFASAGCSSARLAACLPDAPLSEAFLAVYREVDRSLEERGLALRGRRLLAAARRIEAEGAGGIAEFWLDGFHALPDPELQVIAALARHAAVTVTLGESPATAGTRARLLALGFVEERAAGGRPAPALHLAKAAGIEREVEEIARRILEQAAAGRPFREMGIVVRASESYVPLLRSTLERFGIPAAFYFDEPLERHAAVRFLCGIVDAMQGGWEHQQTLAALLLAPRFADSGAMDRFHFLVREQLPNTGLGALKALLLDEDGKPRGPSDERLLHKLDSLAALEEWRSFALRPDQWAARFRTLRNYFRPARPAPVSHQMALELKSQAAVLDLFDEALEEAARALDGTREIELPEFWRTVKSVLRLKPLRLEDGRRNVVHVLSAPEARQWVLPVVFVCGLVEKQFPRFHPQDPFFSDAARCALNAAGIRVRTAAEFETEERALFDTAISRAALLTVLSYPEFDSRGDRLLPSLYLEGLFLQAAEGPPVRPAPGAAAAAIHATLAAPARIQAPAGLEYLNARSTRLSPSAIESYLQCGFQYFSRQALRLKPAPLRPQDRLDFLTCGTIVHAVLKQWWGSGKRIEAVFEEEFARALEDKRIPQAYRTERLRNAMLDDLRAFAAGDAWPLADYTSQTEQEFLFTLDGAVEISGKIDRLDTTADGRAYVIDYKYSGSQNTKAKLSNDNLVQAPLYLMAAERVFQKRPAGMFYVGLKGGPLYVGWSEPPMMQSNPLPEDWLEKAEARVLGVLRQIRAGRIEVAPADPRSCRFCDYRDACRVRAREADSMAEGA